MRRMATPLPNPHTPLAFLPPTLASQFEVSRYIHVATCGMFAWDVLLNLRNDWDLLTKHRVGLPTVVYFISRIAAFAYIICATTFNIGSVGDCQKLLNAVGWTFVAAVSSNSFLFLIRVKTIFANNRYITALFAFLWTATLAGVTIVPFAISGAHIGPTDHCINTVVKPFSSTGVVISMVNDTLVFLFISWRLLQWSMYDRSAAGQLISFLRGKDLPMLSRALLQSGQEYYLITVAGNILTTGMILAPASLPVAFHDMFVAPNIALANAMACRVYRDIKFGRISADATSVGAGPTSTSLGFSRQPRKPNTFVDTELGTLDRTTAQGGASDGATVLISQTVHRDLTHSRTAAVNLPDSAANSIFAEQRDNK